MKKLLIKVKNLRPKVFAVFIFAVFLYLLKIIIYKIDQQPQEHLFEPYNIEVAGNQPENGKSIFFIESGDSTTVTFNARQACAIESAALTNPHLKIFVLYTSLSRLKKFKMTPAVEAFYSYPNVFINYMDAKRLSVGSPLEGFIKSEKLASSWYKVEHTSDFLRFLVLWKYGGTYLDMDMIVRKRLDLLPPNYACPESEIYVNNAILNFDQREGKNLSELFMKALVDNYVPTKFASNGPVLLTSVVKNLCRVDELTDINTTKRCQGFNVVKKDSCYPILADEWKLLWRDDQAEKVMQQVKDSMVVHFWNSRSKKKKIDITSNAAYIQIAREFCPKVLATCVDYF